MGLITVDFSIRHLVSAAFKFFSVFKKIFHYQFLQDQYLAVSFDGLLSHLCLALKDLRRLGLLFLILILGSPYRMIFSVPPSQAFTTNFFGPSGVRRGLLHFILDLSIAIYATTKSTICPSGVRSLLGSGL
jgi:hypothetical protein